MYGGHSGNGGFVPPERWYVLKNLVSFKFTANKIVISLEQRKPTLRAIISTNAYIGKHSNWEWAKPMLDNKKSKYSAVGEIARDARTKSHLVVYAVTTQFFDSDNPTNMEVLAGSLSNAMSMDFPSPF